MNRVNQALIAAQVILVILVVLWILKVITHVVLFAVGVAVLVPVLSWAIWSMTRKPASGE